MSGQMRAWTAAIVLAVAGAAYGRIDLRLTGAAESCATSTLRVALYALSDNSQNQSISAMDVVLAWDPAVLQLVGLDTAVNYPYVWLFSGFSNDHALDGLNDTWNDGNALYTALAQLGTPAWAPPGGLLVAQFVFHKLRVGAPTEVEMLANYGRYSHTVVYDGAVPGLNVTGALEDATVTPGARGDTNCDHQVDFNDINPFVQMLSDMPGWVAAHPGCPVTNGDLNCDGHVDFLDINPFVALLDEE